MVGVYQEDTRKPESEGYGKKKLDKAPQVKVRGHSADMGFTILRYPYDSDGKLLEGAIKSVMEAPTRNGNIAVFSQRRGGFGELFIRPHNGESGKKRVTYEYYIVPMSFFARRNQEFNVVVFSDRDNLDVDRTILNTENMNTIRARGAAELMLRKEQMMTGLIQHQVWSMGEWHEEYETIVPDNYSYGSVQLYEGVYFIRRVLGAHIYLYAANVTKESKKVTTSTKEFPPRHTPCSRLNAHDKVTSDTLMAGEVQLIRVISQMHYPQYLFQAISNPIEQDSFHATVSSTTAFTGRATSSPPVEEGSIYSPVKIDRLAERVKELARLLNSHNLPQRAD